jgi:hypothetical protein
LTHSRWIKSRGDSVKSMDLLMQIGPWRKSVRLIPRTRDESIFLS